MQPEPLKYLWDVLEASEKIDRFVQGKSYEDYVADELLRSAVERQLGIVGEALSRLARVDPEIAKLVPNLRQVIAFRNVLIHGYTSIDDRLVWGIVESYLPALLAVVSKLHDDGGG